MSTDGIAATLFPKTRRLILRELVTCGSDGLHLREIARRSELDPAGVMRELAKLVKCGIITEKKQGVQKIFTLNKSSPIYAELKNLIVKTVGVADLIRESLESVKENIRFAYIFGSFAAGTEDDVSDVDLMIVGDISLEEVIGVLTDARVKVSRVISPKILSLKEYSSLKKERNGFINQISRGPKIMLFGDENDT